MKKSSWLFITAALGDETWQGPAARLTNQAKATGLFDSFATFTQKDLEILCPQMYDLLGSNPISTSNNFGYYSWKPSLAKAALSGYWGEFDGVAYLDAGSELFINPISIRVLKSYIKIAVQYGVCAFQINTPESSFTKRELFDCFPELTYPDHSPQFQAGGWFLHGVTGKQVASEWNSKTWERNVNINPYYDPVIQEPSFVAPRFDQSVFSLTLKKFQISPISPAPLSDLSRNIDKLRAVKSPILWLRNKSSLSVMPVSFRVLTYIYLECINRVKLKSKDVKRVD